MALSSTVSIVAPQRRRNAVIRAFVARLSQCAGNILGNALPLLLNFWINSGGTALRGTTFPEYASHETPPEGATVRD